jgi:hypothetical protein
MHPSPTQPAVRPLVTCDRQPMARGLTRAPTPLHILSIEIVPIALHSTLAIRPRTPQRPALLRVLRLPLYLHVPEMSLLRVQRAAHLFLVDHHDHDDTGLRVGAHERSAVDPAWTAFVVVFWIDSVDGGIIVKWSVLMFVPWRVREPRYFCRDADALRECIYDAVTDVLGAADSIHQLGLR